MLFAELTVLAEPTRFDAPLNMAVDEVLLQTATAPMLRCYGWAEPCLSLGYFVPYAEAAAHPQPGPRVRRWTGGGMVPHGADFTYTLVVPRAHPFAQIAPAESYALLHRAVAEALRSVLPTRFTLAAAAAPAISRACFENPAADDIMAGDRKIAGAAQRRTRWGLLHQGSIQLGGGAKLEPQSFSASFSRHLNSDVLSETTLGAAQDLSLQKYRCPAWLHRF